jgi:hypothetical protein
MSPEAEADAADRCIVPGCEGAVVRRLALAEVRPAFDGLPEKGRRAPLCREHYRSWKKATKERRKLDRLAR